MTVACQDHTEALWRFIRDGKRMAHEEPGRIYPSTKRLVQAAYRVTRSLGYQPTLRVVVVGEQSTLRVVAAEEQAPEAVA